MTRTDNSHASRDLKTWDIEYFRAKETGDAPLPIAFARTDRSGFFCDGHRLSSLYRGATLARLTLTTSEDRGALAVSFAKKYSNPTPKGAPSSGRGLA